MDPNIIVAASQFLSKALRYQEDIFGDMEVQYRRGASNKIGDVLIRDQPLAKRFQSINLFNELEKVLDKIKRETSPKPIPSMAEAMKWEKMFN